MDFVLDFILHIDRYMIEIVRDYHTWTYAILFLIIFCETGLVVTPFLPGDSLLFVAGAVAAQPDMPLQVNLLALIVFGAAVLGDSCNYEIGRFLGAKLFGNPNSKIFKQQYLDKTHEFYKKYGGKNYYYRSFCSDSSNFCSVCCRNGKNALLLFYYLQRSRWSLVGSIVLLCRIFFWRSAFRSEKFEDTDHCNHCRLYITGHNRGIASEIDRKK